MPIELHCLASHDAADWSSVEKAIQNVETNMPSGRTHRDEAAIEVLPERQACAATRRFEYPSNIIVLKQLGSVGSRHACFQNLRSSRPGEIHCSNRGEAAIDIERRPF